MITKRDHIRFKSALTRARKVGPDAVIAAATGALIFFEENGYPDDWHRWERARDDAQLEKLYAR